MSCPRSPRIVGQTLFLGASVVSVNMNLGWGDTSSSATIELIEDFQPCNGISQYNNNYPENHYYGCCPNGYNCPDDCYVDERGNIYDSNRTATINGQTINDPPKEKNVPGKIYYAWSDTKGWVSRYWYNGDPGFFGTGTSVQPDGTINPSIPKVYNLINVPVFFKFDSMSYMGIIKSWDINYANGRNFYRVEIESVGSLLRNSWMIVDGYAGAIFSQTANNSIGTATNFTGDGLIHNGTITEGAIHNVFNIYGFLESLGPYGFGGSNKNDNGISYSKILKALKILTSSKTVNDLNWHSKRMFSPFGRILAKTMHTMDSDLTNINTTFGQYAFGVVPPELDSRNQPRSGFSLDLSELIIPPEDVRFNTSNKVIRVSEFLQNLVDKNGQQTYHITAHSLVNNNLPYNIIKIKAADRTTYASVTSVTQVVNNLINNGFNVTSSNIGQVRNDDAKVRTMIIGGNQQRLYQAKNYRLGFNQSNYVWNPTNGIFVNYRRFQNENDKVKIPIGLSVRNPTIQINFTPELYNFDNVIINFLFGNTAYFNKTDNIWDDDIATVSSSICNTILRINDLEIDRNTGQYTSSGMYRYDSGPGSIPYYGRYGNYELEFSSSGYVNRPTVFSPSSFKQYKKSSTTSTSSASNQQQASPVNPTPTPSPQPSSGGNNSPNAGPLPTPTGQSSKPPRFINLSNDVISPFFGFKHDKTLIISTNNTNIHRYIRPVYLDTWTGQISVSFDINEAPPVSCGAIVSLYDRIATKVSSTIGGNTALTAPAGASAGGNNPNTTPAQSQSPSPSGTSSNTTAYIGVGFTVTETEMRAAMKGFDSYFKYCMSKMPETKPDLYLMLLNCWVGKGILSTEGMKSLPTLPGASLSTSTTAGQGTNSLAPSAGHKQPTISVAGYAGQPSGKRSAHKTKLTDIDFIKIFHSGFIEDLKIICNFIQKLGNEYYGKQYLIKLPILLSYKDQQYTNTQIPGFNNSNILVFSGSGKIFYNYNLIDKAWEEYGNYIDNEIVVGGPHWKALSDNQGLIPPLLGFNASDTYDYVRAAWCALDAANKIQSIKQHVDNLNTFVTTPAFSDHFSSNISTTQTPRNWNISTLADNGNGILVPTQIPYNASDTILKQILLLTDSEFNLYKEYAARRDNIQAIYDSMPSSLECTATQSVSSGTPDTNGNIPYNTLTTISINNQAFTIPGIDYSSLGDPKDYVIINTNPFSDPYAGCNGGKKIYLKAGLGNNAEIAYGNPAGLTDPRVVLTIPKAITLAKASLAYREDPNQFLMPNVVIEDYSYYMNKYYYDTSIPLTERNYLNYLLETFVTPVVSTPGMVSTPPSSSAYSFLLYKGSTANQSSSFTKITPKAAQAFFGAVPIKSNTYTYGPWTNRGKSERLTDNINIIYSNDYVPWNYGGMSFLDKAVSYELKQNENDQIIQHKGSVKIYGPPVFDLGGQFAYDAIDSFISSSYYTIEKETIFTRDFGDDINNIIQFTANDYDIIYIKENRLAAVSYPIVQGISVNVGVDGINTSYTLGTYNPKLGIYNKERIDENKNLTKNILGISSTINNIQNSQQNQGFNNIFSMINEIQRYLPSDATSRQAQNLESEKFSSSPTEVLVGQSRYFMPDPKTKAVNNKTMYEKSRHETWAGLYMAGELGTELLSDYKNKSAMSLDGIFSPISFYPTEYDSTHPLSNYFTARELIVSSGMQQDFTCPICLNSRFIYDFYVDYSNEDQTTRETSQKTKYPCPSCSRSRVSRIKGSGNPKDSVARVSIDNKNSKPQINFYSLNPIVVSAGEFQNPNSPNNKKENITSGIVVYDQHSIRTVSRGDTLPSEYNIDTTVNLTYNTGYISRDYDGYDSELSVLYGSGLFPLNQRFFGFRGPIMLHGWGYDTDGYPVPNLNDDPYSIDQYGRYFRFQLTSDGFNDINLPGLYEPINNKPLGDIITKKYEFRNNKWKGKLTPSKYFSTNWASKSNTWPVGPIDLRWDHERRVWVGGGDCGPEKLPPFIITNSYDSSTLVEYLENKSTSGCPYKMVYITLEQDLTRPNNLYFYSNIVRGYIDDLEYKSEPLQAGYRRLVYLIDRSGYTAPAGTRLYCKYNPDLGYYEPISKPVIVTTGIILGNQARIDLSFAKGRLANSTPTSVVNFANPLTFFVSEGKKAIFSFIDGSWTLTSINNN